MDPLRPAAGGEGRGLGAGPLSPGHRPHLVQWHPHPTRGAQVGAGAVGSGDREFRFHPRNSSSRSPRCSCWSQMFLLVPDVPNEKKNISLKGVRCSVIRTNSSEYKHHLRSAWGPQAPGVWWGWLETPPEEWGGSALHHPPGDGGLVGLWAGGP